MERLLCSISLYVLYSCLAWCVFFLSHSKERDVNDDKEKRRSKHYRRLTAEIFPPSQSAPSKTQQESTPQPKFIYFPAEAQKLCQQLEDGSSHLNIYIRRKEVCNSRISVTFPSLERLHTLGIYHSLTISGDYDEKKIKALLPLLAAPNLKRVEFTCFLAEPLLPLIPPYVKVVANFQSYDISEIRHDSILG